MARKIHKVKKYILIVDDEPAVRRTVRSALESAGYECAESENGAAALAWLEENKADVLIADYHMPVLSGLKLLERFRSKMNGKSHSGYHVKWPSQRERQTKGERPRGLCHCRQTV